MQSVIDFRDLLTKNWNNHDPLSINMVVDAFFTHALLCRTKVDSPPGAFRDFAARTCKMTRRDTKLRMFHEYVNDNEDDKAERRAACEALFDLIMEGV